MFSGRPRDVFIRSHYIRTTTRNKFRCFFLKIVKFLDCKKTSCLIYGVVSWRSTSRSTFLRRGYEKEIYFLNFSREFLLIRGIWRKREFRNAISLKILLFFFSLFPFPFFFFFFPRLRDKPLDSKDIARVKARHGNPLGEPPSPLWRAPPRILARDLQTFKDATMQTGVRLQWCWGKYRAATLRYRSSFS